MIRAKRYENIFKFVKVMYRILWALFFPDTVYISCSICLPKILKIGFDICQRYRRRRKDKAGLFKNMSAMCSNTLVYCTDCPLY